MGGCGGKGDSPPRHDIVAPQHPTDRDLTAVKYNLSDPGALRNYVLQCDVALVRAGYLIELARDPAGRVRRRQDLPSRAFVPRDQILRWRGTFHGPGTPVMPELICLSYPWLSPDHPDPRGDHLRALCAYGDALGVSQRLPAPLRDGAWVFWDFLSLHQPPFRAEEEARQWQAAVADMQCLYAHDATHVARIEHVPQWARRSRPPYGASAWCHFERAVAGKAEPSSYVVVDAGGRCPTEAARCARPAPPPPLTPEQYEQQLSRMQLSVEADRPVLRALQRKVYAHQLGKRGAPGFPA